MCIKTKRICLILMVVMFVLSSCGKKDYDDFTPRIKKDIATVIRENENYSDYVAIDDLEEVSIRGKWRKVKVNLSSELPEADTLPVYQYSSVYFEEHEAEEIIRAFAGKDVSFYKTGNHSLKYYQAKLQSINETIESLEQEKLELTEPMVIESYDVQTGEEGYVTIDEEYLDQEIAAEKAEASKIVNIIRNYKVQDKETVSLKYTTDPDELYDEETKVLRASFDIGDNTYIVYTLFDGKLIRVGKMDVEDETIPVTYSNLEDDGSYSVGISRDKAGRQAEEFISRVAPEYQLRNAYPAVSYMHEDNEEFVWQFYFTRTIDGTEVFFEDHEIDMSSISRPPVRYETISVAVSSEGVVGFTWQFPLEKKELISDNVRLMPESQILSIAKNYFELQEIEGISLKTMKLSYARIDKEGDYDSFYYVPVWDYIGEMSGDYMYGWVDFSTYSFLTINALDGTIIDRTIGY